MPVGRKSWATVCWAALAAVPSESAFPKSDGVELQVTLAMVAHEDQPVSVPVTLRATPLTAAESARHVDTLEAESTAPATTHFSLPPNSSWRLEVTAEGFWAQPRVVDLESQSRAVDVTLYRAGWVDGVLRPPRGESGPSEIEVRLQPAPDNLQKTPLATVTCPLNDQSFRCLVPSAKLDLRIRAPEYVAHYFWDVSIPWRGNRSLGTFELRRGASVVGWIEAPSPNFEGAKVELFPQLTGFAYEGTTRHRHASMSLSASVNRRGFFQVPSVPPGSYTLTARHPELAPARVAPVVVEEGSETELDLIALQPMASLNVLLTPPRDPFKKAWRLKLFQQSPDPSLWDLAEEAVATPLGTWDLTGLEPAEYQLHVDDSRGSRWASETVTLSHDAPPLEIDLPAVRLEGHVTLGGESVPSTSVLLTEHRGGAKISVRGTDRGRFYVFLPRGKMWDVRIEQTKLQVIGLIKDVQVPARKAGDRWPKKEFEIPDTIIEGQVGMADGSSLPEPAMVHVTRGGGRSYTTDEMGDFEIRGVDPGKLHLQAEIPERNLRSELLQMELSGRERIGPLELELRADVRLSGMVLSPTGVGIPGTRVVITLVSASDVLLNRTIPEGYTDMDGVFDIPLPAVAHEVLMTVFPPGFAATQERFVLPDDGSPLVTAEEAGGTVVVVYEGMEELDPFQTGQVKTRTTLLHDSSVLAHYFALRAWANLHGISDPHRLVVPMLEPGWYTACADPDATRIAHRGVNLPPQIEARCVSGNLAPNGELILQIPSSVWRPLVAETSPPASVK